MVNLWLPGNQDSLSRHIPCLTILTRTHAVMLPQPGQPVCSHLAMKRSFLSTFKVPNHAFMHLCSCPVLVFNSLKRCLSLLLQTKMLFSLHRMLLDLIMRWRISFHCLIINACWSYVVVCTSFRLRVLVPPLQER